MLFSVLICYMVDMTKIILIVSLVWYCVQCTDSQRISVDQPEDWIDPTDMVCSYTVDDCSYTL